MTKLVKLFEGSYVNSAHVLSVDVEGVAADEWNVVVTMRDAHRVFVTPYDLGEDEPWDMERASAMVGVIADLLSQ